MSRAFEPRLAILPAGQRALWERLGEVPEDFVLYGGTAIALRLGHRESLDFDFFGARDFDPGALRGSIGFLGGAEIVQQAPNTLVCRVNSEFGVLVSFFGVPRLKRVAEPDRVVHPGVRVASLVDLAGTKAAVVQRRAEAKDYVDLDALVVSGIPLATALAAAGAIYGAEFNPQLTLKALSYYGDGDLADVPVAVRERLVRAVRETDLDALPRLTALEVGS